MTKPEADPRRAGEILNMGLVDSDPRSGRATEADEERVLRELYGPPDDDGVYRRTGAGEDA